MGSSLGSRQVGELDFLRDLVVVFGVSIGIVYVFDKLRVPTLVGFEVFAEIGIVLLLVTLGDKTHAS